MFRLFVVLLASAVPHWMMSNWSYGCDEEATAVAGVWVTADGNTVNIAEGQPMVFVAQTDPSGQAAVTANAVIAVEGAPIDGHKKTIVLRKTGTANMEADPHRGWLGVSVGQVPDALSAQLGTGQSGAIILNIAKDSPADRAGLQVHDVIVSIAGEKIVGDTNSAVGQTASMIGSHKPGEAIDLVVLREGSQKTLRATLESRPDMKSFAWKFDMTPNAEIEDKVRVGGKVFQVGPNGQWEWSNLGDLGQLADLHKNFQFMPQGGNYTMKVFVDGGKQTIKTETKVGDGTLSVEQVDNGPITVTRTDNNGKATTAQYPTEDALRAADAEAADLFDRTSNSMVVHVDVDGLADIDVELDDVDVEELHANLMESFEEANEAYQRAMEEFQEAQKQWQEQMNNAGDGRSEPSAAPKFRMNVPPVPLFAGAGAIHKARQTFEVRPDGTIEVKIRKGDSEVVRLFANEADLKNRDANLYEKYQSVISDNE